MELVNAMELNRNPGERSEVEGPALPPYFIGPPLTVN